MTSSTVAFAGGGTAGHLYPALAVTEALRAALPGARFIYFTTKRTIDTTVLGKSGADVTLVQQPVQPLSRAPWRWPGFMAAWAQSSQLCRSVLAERRPAMVIGSGGYASVPAIRTARAMGIPTALLNPDAIPGRANRLLGRSADLIFAQWDDTRRYFQGHFGFCVCGCPVRPAFRSATRAQGVARFGLDPLRKTLLVTGASLGARTINDAIIRLLPRFAALADWQVLHLTGAQDYERVSQAVASAGATCVRVLAYTDQMPEALAAADLVVARAGASTLAELTAVGRAAILMPYPFHRDQHQLANARVLANAGAAVIVHDRKDVETNLSALGNELLPLMTDDTARQRLAEAAQRLGTFSAASSIARRIIDHLRADQAIPPSGCVALCAAKG